MIESLADRVNADAWLLHRGRFLTTQFLLEVGADQYLIRIAGGRIEAIVKGPFVMPRWTFALRAPADAWAKFWSAAPRPGFHDLMALVKSRTLRIEGDQYPLICNLQYFKDVLVKLRGKAE